MPRALDARVPLGDPAVVTPDDGDGEGAAAVGSDPAPEGPVEAGASVERDAAVVAGDGEAGAGPGAGGEAFRWASEPTVCSICWRPICTANWPTRRAACNWPSTRCRPFATRWGNSSAAVAASPAGPYTNRS